MKHIPTLLIGMILSITPIKNIEGEISFVDKYYHMKEYEEILKREVHREITLQSIITVESKGDASAYNAKEDAVGILQIRPIMLRHANKIIGFEKYTLDDRWSKDKSIEIFWTVQEYYNPDIDLEQACHLWNAGIPNKRKWEITEKYRNLVLTQYNRLYDNSFLRNKIELTLIQNV